MNTVVAKYGMINWTVIIIISVDKQYRIMRILLDCECSVKFLDKLKEVAAIS